MTERRTRRGKTVESFFCNACKRSQSVASRQAHVNPESGNRIVDIYLKVCRTCIKRAEMRGYKDGLRDEKGTGLSDFATKKEG